MYTKIEAHYVHLHACVESKVPAGRKARMLSQKQDVHSIPIRKNLKEREYTHYNKTSENGEVAIYSYSLFPFHMVHIFIIFHGP